MICNVRLRTSQLNIFLFSQMKLSADKVTFSRWDISNLYKEMMTKLKIYLLIDFLNMNLHKHCKNLNIMMVNETVCVNTNIIVDNLCLHIKYNAYELSMIIKDANIAYKVKSQHGKNKLFDVTQYYLHLPFMSYDGKG